MAENPDQGGFNVRLQRAVQLAGGIADVSRELGRGVSTLYTWFKPGGSPPVGDALRILEMSGVRAAWLFAGEGPMRDGESPAPADAAEPVDTVEIPVLTAPASAGAGALLSEAAEERGTVTFPRAWAREFGTPARLRLVEIVGDSMQPDLDSGDWLLVNLDLVELRDGIALCRLDDALLVKRTQPQGRRLLLTSSNPAYHPITVDLARDDFAVIGYGRWKTGRLA